MSIELLSPSSTRGRRGLLRAGALVLVALVLGALFLVSRSPSGTHGGLDAASPGPDAHVSRTPGQVLLDFGRTPVGDRRATVTVVGPDDSDLARGSATSTGSEVSQPIAAPQRRGAYQVSYELVAPDGAVTSGRYWFWWAPDTSRWAGVTWSATYVLLGLMALGSLALALLRHRRRGVPAAPVVPARGPVVPAQRSRDQHEGASPPGRRPRPVVEREVVEDDTRPHGS